MSWLRTILVVSFVAALSLLFSGCEDSDNFLEGSLSSQYDLSFDSVRARQFLQSRQLHVEYLRGEGTGEEKPIMATISPTPDGPGTFTYDTGQVNITNSLAPGNPALPAVTQGEVVVTTFTSESSGSEVVGEIHGMFTNLGTGDAFSLEGAFSTTLEVMP